MAATPTERTFRVTVEEKDLTVASKYRPGSEEVIIFLHGYACSKNLFHQAWRAPALEQYSMLCPDFIGFGDSDKPDEFAYSLEAHAAVLEELLKQVDGGALHIIGHSMGGAIVLLLSPNRINALTSFANVEGNLLSNPVSGDAPRKPSVPRKREDLAVFRQAQSAAADTALHRTGESLVQWSRGGYLLKRFQSAQCRKAYFHGDDKGELRLRSELQDCNPIQIPNSLQKPEEQGVTQAHCSFPRTREDQSQNWIAIVLSSTIRSIEFLITLFVFKTVILLSCSSATFKMTSSPKDDPNDTTPAKSSITGNVFSVDITRNAFFPSGLSVSVDPNCIILTVLIMSP